MGSVSNSEQGLVDKAKGLFLATGLRLLSSARTSRGYFGPYFTPQITVLINRSPLMP